MDRDLAKLLLDTFPSIFEQNCADRDAPAVKTQTSAQQWSEEEETYLIELKEQGKYQWSEISDILALRYPRKSAAQISQHWRRVVTPKMAKNENVDIEKVMDLYTKLGNKWALIAKIIGGVSDLEIKHMVQRRQDQNSQ